MAGVQSLCSAPIFFSVHFKIRVRDPAPCHFWFWIGHHGGLTDVSQGVPRGGSQVDLVQQRI